MQSHSELTIAVLIVVGLTTLFFMIGPAFFLGTHYYSATEQYYRDSYARSMALVNATWAPATFTQVLTGFSWSTAALEDASPSYQGALNELDAARAPQQRTEQAENGVPVPPEEYQALRAAVTARLNHARDLIHQGERSIRLAYLWHTFWALLPLAVVATAVCLVWASRRLTPTSQSPDAIPFSTKMMIVPQTMWIRPRYGDPARVPELASAVAPFASDPVIAELLRIYAAHPECPASIGHHGNVKGGLQLHLSLVMAKTEKLLQISRNANPDLHPDYHQLARWIALAHDLGKVVAYRRAPSGQWVNTGLPHDRISALLLSAMPSVRALPDEMRWILIRTVRYYHDKHELPIDTPIVAKKLIELINDAEKLASEEEAAHVKARLKIVAPHVGPALDRALVALNINHLKFGPPQGWVCKTYPYLFVLEWQLRETLVAQLPDAIRGELPIMHRETGLSPLWDHIKQELMARQWLVTTIDTKRASHDGFFKCRVDQQLFQMVVALDLAKLPVPLVTKWKAGRAPDLYVL
jgi:hypothetical protein